MKALIAVAGTKKPKSKGVPKGRAMHIRIKRMDNGAFNVDSDHEGAHKGGGGKKGKAIGLMGMGMEPPMESHSAGFGGADDAMAHVGQLMGAGGPPAPEAPPAPAAPAGGAPAPEDEE
jgi:hypothetical protein